MIRSDNHRAGVLRILVIDADEFNVQAARSLIDRVEAIEVVGVAADPAEGLRQVARLHPDLVLLELPAEPATALEAAAQLFAALPGIQIIASAGQPRAELFQQAMRAGVRDILRRPFDPPELDAALAASRGVQLKRQAGSLQVAEVIAFCGAGGGLGTTTLAVNTAVALARQPAMPVLLADLDIGGGSVSLFLDLDEHALTLTELLARDHSSDSLPALLPTHKSGLQVLPGPERLEDLEAVRPEELSDLVTLCRGAYRFIVLDVGHAVTDASLAVLDRAEQIYLVTQMSLPSLQGAARRLDLFRRLGHPDERFAVVLNRGRKRANISPAEAQRILGVPFAHQIDSDYGAVLGAIDAGVPLIGQRRGRRVSRQIEALARRHLAAGEFPPAEQC